MKFTKMKKVMTATVLAVLALALLVQTPLIGAGATAAATAELQIIPLIKYRNSDGSVTDWETPTTVHRNYHFGALENPATGQKLTPMKSDEQYEIRFYEGTDPEPWRKNIAPPSPGFDVVTIGRPQFDPVTGAKNPMLFCFQKAKP